MYPRLAVAFVALVLAAPTHAVTLDLNVDLAGVTQTTTTRSVGLFGTGWEQTTSGGFFPTYSLSATTEHFVEVAIPWSTNNWSDFTRPLRDPAPVSVRIDARPNPASSTLIPFTNSFIDLVFDQTEEPAGNEGGALVVTPDPPSLFVIGDLPGPVEFLDPSDFLPYDVVDFVLQRSFTVAEPDGNGGFFFAVSTATDADYVFAGGELIRIDATREGQLTQLSFDGDVLLSVTTSEGPLSDGDFVRDRSGWLFEVGQPIPEDLIPVAFDMLIADQTFGSGDWSSTITELSGGATHAAQFMSSDGNPDAHRQMEHFLPGTASIEVFHGYEAVTFSPSAEGPILHVDYAEDRIERTPPFAGAAVGAAPALLQDGVVYAGPSINFTDTTWTTLNLSALVAGDFDDGTGLHPDFSESGTEIQFGYIRRNSSGNPGSTFSVFSGIDNWSYNVHYLPEPSIALGLGCGGALLTLLFRRPREVARSSRWRLSECTRKGHVVPARPFCENAWYRSCGKRRLFRPPLSREFSAHR